MRLSFLFLSLFLSNIISAQADNKPANKKELEVIAYYSGNLTGMNDYPVEKLTQIIYSFCHLSGNRLYVSNANDSNTIKNLVLLKKRNPGLKVLLSLGGWTGCYTCSGVFSTPEGRNEFAKSVKEINDYFETDGIDLDWEYPTVQGPPGHPFSPADKYNFTSLIKKLRKTLGKKMEISFAAGGYSFYLENAVEWKKIMPLVNRVNLMTYDLVHGYSTSTGHHTPLFSTPYQKESIDNAVNYLLSNGIPSNKLVIGAAIYARVFKITESNNYGLYQPGNFRNGVSYKNFDSVLTPEKGYQYYWDDVAAAPYYYNKADSLFVTGDDSSSIARKTMYAIDKKLKGIMFWQLMDDKTTNGLLDVIDRSRQRQNND